MITLIVLMLICAPFIWWYAFLQKNKSIGGIPGPKPLPLVGNALHMGNSPQQFLTNIMKFRKEHGTIYKIFIANEIRIMVSAPELTEQVLSSTVVITKSNAYDLLKPWLGEGLLISTGPKWKSRRRMITPTFHFKILDEFLEIFNSCGNVLVEKLLSEVGKSSVDIYPFINLYSLDVICESSMGVKVAAQQGENTEYVEAVRDYLHMFMLRAFSAWKRIDFLFSMSGVYEKYKTLLKVLHNFTNTVIRTRREQKLQQKSGPTLTEDGIKRRVALLDMLLESADDNKLTDEDIREEIDTFMFEGHDTTTSGISFAILCLAQNQEVQEKVYEEIISVIGDEKDITMAHLQETKYLELVIKEVQRLYPSVPIFERLVEDEFTIGSFKVPKGVFISLLVFGMHRDEKYFPHPEKFEPYRFLPENQKNRHNYAYVPFSAGPRNCIGQKFAMLEMKSSIVKIVQQFRILPVPGFKEELGMTAVLKSFNGICVRLQPRNDK